MRKAAENVTTDGAMSAITLDILKSHAPSEQWHRGFLLYLLGMHPPRESKVKQ